MEQEYISALSEQVNQEVDLFGESIEINGVSLKGLISQSATLKNLQVAGFYRNQVLDVLVPLYTEVPRLNQIVIYSAKTYQIKTIENLEYNTGYRITIELIP